MRLQNFYNLMVVNKTTGRGVFGQPNGHFTAYANPGDLIALSTKGYPVYQFIVQPDDHCQTKVLAYVERLPQEVAEVVVRPLKTLEQIKQKVGLEPLEQVLAEATAYLNSLLGVKVEYLQAADEHTLVPVLHWEDDGKKRVFVALFLGEVRLIDNLKL